MTVSSNNLGAIYRGAVVHQRVHPTRHKLKYRVFSLLLDVDALDTTAKKLRCFSVDRFNLLSIRQSDHGNRDETPLRDFAWETVRKAGVEDHVKSVKILFYPRLLGVAFNPLTVYFCLDGDGAPILMIYEVRNTFGENLTYVVPAGKDRNGTYSHNSPKQFYVSPFNDVDGDYTFHVKTPDMEIIVGVALKVGRQALLRTHFRGDRHALSDRALLKAYFSYPMMTLKVVAGIHWEALKLWRKGLSLKERPAPPPDPVVFN